MNCFWRHQWGKWEQYDRRYTWAPCDLDGRADLTKEFRKCDIRQKRTCATCGKMQDELVQRDNSLFNMEPHS